MAQAGGTFKQFVDVGYIYVIDPLTSYADHMVMRLDVAVVTRCIVQQGYLACLSHLAKFVEDSMDRGQRHVRMIAAHSRANFIGARMIFRSEQRLYHRQALRCDWNTTLAAPRNEVT